MVSINISQYYPSLGPLIDLEDNTDFNIKHIPGAINIPYEELLYNRSKILDKNRTYYVYCQGGYKSKKATNILNAYGYNLIQVILNK